MAIKLSTAAPWVPAAVVSVSFLTMYTWSDLPAKKWYQQMIPSGIRCCLTHFTYPEAGKYSTAMLLICHIMSYVNMDSDVMHLVTDHQNHCQTNISCRIYVHHILDGAACDYWHIGHIFSECNKWSMQAMTNMHVLLNDLPWLSHNKTFKV